jgi:hypothetical protein
LHTVNSCGVSCITSLRVPLPWPFPEFRGGKLDCEICVVIGESVSQRAWLGFRVAPTLNPILGLMEHARNMHLGLMEHAARVRFGVRVRNSLAGLVLG